MTDPVENVIVRVLDGLDLEYEREKAHPNNTRHLDFYVPSLDLWIECCRFHTPRKIEQLDGLDNVILIQGLDAAKIFEQLTKGSIHL